MTFHLCKHNVPQDILSKYKYSYGHYYDDFVFSNRNRFKMSHCVIIDLSEEDIIYLTLCNTYMCVIPRVRISDIILENLKNGNAPM